MNEIQRLEKLIKLRMASHRNSLEQCCPDYDGEIDYNARISELGWVLYKIKLILSE